MLTVSGTSKGQSLLEHQIPDRLKVKKIVKGLSRDETTGMVLSSEVRDLFVAMLGIDAEVMIQLGLGLDARVRC